MAIATDGAALTDRARFPYRMKDLMELTGLPRQVIHFYIQQGLLPEGHKTGRNMAYYGEEHLARIRMIRKLQHEHFLPLKAIRALFEERDHAFSPAQRQLLADVKQRLAKELVPKGHAERVDADALLERAGLTREELFAMVEVGLLGVSEDESGRLMVSRDDAWMIELWGQVRALGFGPELGFSPRDLMMYEEAMSALFRRETRMLAERLAHLPPERVAEMVERVLPLVNGFLARYHATKVRNLFTVL